MKNKRMAIFLSVAILAGVAFAGTKLSERSTAANSVPKFTLPTPVSADSNQRPAETGVPKHIAYGLFFGEMMALKKKAVERQKQGMKRAKRCATFTNCELKVSDHESRC